jgi:hypothetical protein
VSSTGRSSWKRRRRNCPAGWSRSRRASPNLTEIARSFGIFRRGARVFLLYQKEGCGLAAISASNGSVLPPCWQTLYQLTAGRYRPAVCHSGLRAVGGLGDASR